jgi:hypothetical protein
LKRGLPNGVEGLILLVWGDNFGKYIHQSKTQPLK